jgi:hypothetical protein
VQSADRFDVDAAGCLLPSLVCSGRHLDLRKVAGLKAEGDSPFAYFWWVHPTKNAGSATVTEKR